MHFVRSLCFTFRFISCEFVAWFCCFCIRIFVKMSYIRRYILKSVCSSKCVVFNLMDNMRWIVDKMLQTYCSVKCWHHYIEIVECIVFKSQQLLLRTMETFDAIRCNASYMYEIDNKNNNKHSSKLNLKLLFILLGHFSLHGALFFFFFFANPMPFRTLL